MPIGARLYVNLSACLPACPPACLPACPLACLPACLPVCLPACPPACLPARLPACPPAFLLACLTTCLPARVQLKERELLQSCGKNMYEKAVLLMQMAPFQADSQKQAQMLQVGLPACWPAYLLAWLGGYRTAFACQPEQVSGVGGGQVLIFLACIPLPPPPLWLCTCHLLQLNIACPGPPPTPPPFQEAADTLLKVQACEDSLFASQQPEAAAAAAAAGGSPVKTSVPLQPRILQRSCNSLTVSHFPLALRGFKPAKFAVFAKSYGAGVALTMNKTSMEYPGEGGVRGRGGR